MSQIAQVTYPTWEELTHGPTNQESQLLIQAIAVLSTQPAYEKMTPWGVYGKVVDSLKAVTERSRAIGRRRMFEIRRASWH